MSTGIIFGNRILDVAVIACFAAQFYKVFSPLFKGRGASWVRLFQTGGMPSSHASTVVALATSLALLKGMRSVEFAISMVFSSNSSSSRVRPRGKQSSLKLQLLQATADLRGVCTGMFFISALRL